VAQWTEHAIGSSRPKVDRSDTLLYNHRLEKGLRAGTVFGQVANHEFEKPRREAI
jgi:hypothetical protein